MSLPIASLDGYSYLRLMMLDSRSRFFDLLDHDFERRITEIIHGGFDVVHLNEFQSLLVVEAFTEETKDQLITLGQNLIRWFRETYGGDVSVVIGGLVDDIKQLYNQFQAIETMLENKFFYDEGTVLLAHHASFGTSEVTVAVDKALNELRHHLSRSRYDIVKLRFQQLFNELQNSEQSVIYIKYTCTEIAKALFDASVKKNAGSFKHHLEKIYRTTKLSDLRRVVLSILEENEPAGTGSSESMRKVIDNVVQIIKHEYKADLSLESLAERVYLSPSYLSHLFKKEMGVSFNKYLTLYRMEKTKELLLKTNRKIIDIGKEVGYSNFPYFSALFKNHYGKTPSQFREEAAQ
ncbi:helix-turn-helix transcriptional regulator [Paenibacillus solisilvae]|uniref:Helix-turn-helix transcriptional regulator n=1 Tax=Paenibacillus solisilvae TaxID=2486751 RepID=A0ABW0VZ13_9BACL